MKKFSGGLTNDGQVFYDMFNDDVIRDMANEPSEKFQQNFINQFCIKFGINESNVSYSLYPIGIDKSGNQFTLKRYKGLSEDLINNLKKSNEIYIKKDFTPIPLDLYRIAYI